MKLALMVDFGSTYTKAVVVSLDQSRVVVRTQSASTVETDVTEGLRNCLSAIHELSGLRLEDFCLKLACSSAAGGLKITVIGLVPELTAEAARLAVLGAGAKVTGTYSFKLSPEDIAKIEREDPDIIILSGGTDGGNKETIMANTRRLAESAISAPIVYAGNRSAASESTAILRASGKTVEVTDNVMPEFGVLKVEPARELVRDIFLRRIVEAKGINKVEKMIDRVLMPTPAAVQRALELLSNGCGAEPGIGELVAVDIGGATTDVISIAQGEPNTPGVTRKGLPEPRVKRTVEGDLGLRVSASSLAEAIGFDKLADKTGWSREQVESKIRLFSTETWAVPENPEDERFDTLLASEAARIASSRHAGTLAESYAPWGKVLVQRGKDLTGVVCVIGTGGVIVHSRKPEDILSSVLYSSDTPESLRPVSAVFKVDRNYLLFASGLLSAVYPTIALNILKRGLEMGEDVD